MIRVYLPATLSLVARLRADGQLPAPAGPVHAVTAALREWYHDGDAEELEYVAFTRAAQDALLLLQDDPAVPRRRAVISIDVPAKGVAAVHQATLGASVVKLSDPVEFGDVAAVHVDDAAAEAAVAAAAQVAREAAAGDADAQLTVEEAADHDLLWYAPEELNDLLSRS